MKVLVCSGNEGKLREFRAVLGDWPLCGWKGLAAILGSEVEEPVEATGFFLGNALVKAHAGAKALLAHRTKHHSAAEGDRWWILADDSGLCIPALAMQPGVDSAIFGGEPRDDAKNRSALTSAIARCPLAVVGPIGEEKRLSAFFLCVLVVLEPNALTAENVAALDPAAPGFATGVGAALRQRERAFLHSISSALAAGQEAPVESALHEGVRFIVAGCGGQVSTLEQQHLPGEGHGYDPLFYPAQWPHLSFGSIALADKNAVSHRGRALARLGEELRRDAT